MNKNIFLAIIILMVVLTMPLAAQHRFSNCSAAFLDGKIIVDEYSPKGKCILNTTASGKLAVRTATYENNQWLAGDKIAFKVTIRDGVSKTLLSYSDATYEEIDIKQVLSKCRKGDAILISILKDEFALPHNEILVE